MVCMGRLDSRDSIEWKEILDSVVCEAVGLCGFLAFAYLRVGVG